MPYAHLVVLVTATQVLMIIAASLGAAASLAGLLALLYNRGLLPNMRQDLQPMITAAEEARDAAREAVRQLTVNGHKSETSTAKDDLSEVKDQLTGLRKDVDKVLTRIERVEVLQTENRTELVQHLRWSNEIVPQLREEISKKADRPEGDD